jgi:catechol 2,3-dioxygenase-like lactoylglutathione lyase family enzyme
VVAAAKIDLFAGIPVREYAAARTWYEQLLGSPPAFFPHETEAVWELAEHRYLYIVEHPEHAGHARLTLFVEGLDSIVANIRARGLEASENETYENGVRKVTYRDPDGNEVGFGGAPLEEGTTPRATRRRRVGKLARKGSPPSRSRPSHAQRRTKRRA